MTRTALNSRLMTTRPYMGPMNVPQRIDTWRERIDKEQRASLQADAEAEATVMMDPGDAKLLSTCRSTCCYRGFVHLSARALAYPLPIQR